MSCKRKKTSLRYSEATLKIERSAGALDSVTIKHKPCGTCLQAVPLRTNRPSHLIVQAKTEHRKKLKHYNIPGHAHYLTFSCYHRFDYLSDAASCSIFMEELERARTEFRFYLWAYVLMPNHVHLLIYPYQDAYNISTILQAIKGRTSKRYGAWLREEKPERYKRYLVRIPGAH